MQCAVCGHQNDPASTSCGRCGGALVAVTRHAERRQVTAMFCDLIDSVSLTVRLEAEVMMQVIDLYLAVCDDIVAACGGNVMQYLGDGVLAYFGYPRADEDNVVNAVRAGLEIRDAVARLDLPTGVRLQTRIGIATGMVVVSDLIGKREARGGGIVGETPNLATRLQSIASPDSVVVSDATRRLTAGYFVYNGLGNFSLKGFPEPVPAFEVAQAAPAVNRFLARTRGSATPLIGRDGELTKLLGAWAEAAEGRGRAILLRGEPGIGKSRLVEELRRSVADTPHIQFSWHCEPHSSDTALHPIARQFARAAGFERADDVPTRRARLDKMLARHGAADATGRASIADLLGLPPDPATPAATLTPERRKSVTLDTLLAMMEHVSSLRPALFVIEDLHWSDSTTLEFLDRVVALAPARRWLVLITARPGFTAGWEPNAMVIELDRLDHSSAERICKFIGAGALLSADVVGQIVGRCDGIPLFVEEMTRSVLEGIADAPSRKPLTTVAIPATVRDSLAARLDRLGPARRTACLGAAIGRRFSYELLAAIAAKPEAALRQDLRELTLSGLVDRSGVPPLSTYQFKHALIRDSAYDSLLNRERETLHGQIAQVLRTRFPETRIAEPELLAYHLTESGAIEEAVPLWTEAAQRATSRAAHTEAIGHLRTALALLRRQPTGAERAGAELGLLTSLAVSLAATRGFSAPEVADVLAQARAICDALGDVPGLFAVLRGLCNFAIVGGDLPGAELVARRCLAIGEQTRLPVHRIESHNPLGYILFLKGDLAAARHHLEMVASLYDEHDGATLNYPTPHDPLVSALTALQLVLYAMGDRAGARRAYDRLNSHARALGRSFDLAYSLMFMIMLEIVQENFTAARQLANEAVGICETNGYALIGLVTVIHRAFAAAHLGELEGSLQIVLGSIAEQDKIGSKTGRGDFLGVVAWLRAAGGDLRGALASIDEAIATAQHSGERFLLSPLHRMRAEFLAFMPPSNPALVAAALGEAIEVARAQGAATFARQAEERLGEIVARAAD
jgi:class 3 adenylate cyclase/tetratricopeptide (TPR) repeat protein